MEFIRKTIPLRRVVVTGVGLISPLGKTVPENWGNLQAGRGGIARITRFDVTDHYSQMAGEVKSYDPLAHFDRKELRALDPYIQFALIAADEAVSDSGLKLDNLDRNRAGVYVGSGIGGISTIEANHRVLLERGPTRVSPFFLPASIANLATGQISIKYGLKGPNLANVTACATSTHSVGDSFKIIQMGEADVMLAGGAEYPITPLGMAGFSVMKALSSRNDAPEKASRPFDKERDGFVVSEGASVLVLEDLEHAARRNARIYAEIVGYGFTGDAYHMTAPDPQADGAYRSMKLAIQGGDIRETDVDYINAHGTSTPLNDKYETLAIKRLFGDHARKLPISSTKSMTGHMLGATGGTEAIFTALSLYHAFIPPTINYEVPDEDCDLDYTPNAGRKLEIQYALSNSFGFGGTNGTLLLKRFTD